MSNRTIDIKTKEIYAKLALKWCEKNLGVNSRKRTKLGLCFSEKTKKKDKFIFYGTYCFYRNRILIYLNNCKSMYDLIATIIHEYTHYLQSRTKYKYYEELYYYSHNPYERQAKRNEYKHTKKCIKDIKNHPTISASGISSKKNK
jgi:Zn-dependent peptidase ImmA (M78 family)